MLLIAPMNVTQALGAPHRVPDSMVGGQLSAYHQATGEDDEEQGKGEFKTTIASGQR
jgi:hypothetical protein